MKSVKAPVLYRDRWIECTSEAIIIHGYYFPFANKKTVPYARIRQVRAVPMGPLTGRGRIWGSGDFKHYAHLDPGRPHKRTALVLDVGAFFVPVITPDDPVRVKAIIEAKGHIDSPAGKEGAPGS